MEKSGVITIEDRVKQLQIQIDYLNYNMQQIRQVQKDLPFFSPVYQDLETKFLVLEKECNRILSIIRSLSKYGNPKDTLITYKTN